MKKIRKNINRPSFTPDEIASNQDFDKLIKQHNATGKSFLNKPSTYIAMVIMGIALIAVLHKGKTESKIPFINPPIKGVDVEYVEYTFKPGIDTLLSYKTGSIIHIPKDAFVDKSGKTITDVVKLKYREFHNPAEIFVSGIPMSYDSAGNKYTFESAGMLEILATDKDGNPVYINPNSPIDLALASKQEGNQYNTYYLDTNKRNWSYLRKDTAGKKYINKQDMNGLNNDVSLFKPQKANKKRYHFKIDFEQREFPELAAYDKVLFEVDKNDNGFKPEYASTTWDNIDILRGSTENSYQITISDGDVKHTFSAYPVFEKNDFKDALAIYKNYEKKLKSRKSSELQSQSDMENNLKKMDGKRMQQVEQERQNKAMQQLIEERSKKENIVFRTFQINNFGIYNSDCPLNLPKGPSVVASFIDENKKTINLKVIYLVDKELNAVFTFYALNMGKFKIQYNPNSANIIWGITDDNKIAHLTVEDLKEIGNPGSSKTFKMKTSDVVLKDYNAVKSFLEI